MKQFLSGVLVGALVIFIALNFTKPQETSVDTGNTISIATTETVTIKPDGTKIVKKENKNLVKKEVKVAPIILPKNYLFGYTLEVSLPKTEFYHTVLIGKRVFDKYFNDLYAVAGATIDNKLTLTKAEVGLIKLY